MRVGNRVADDTGRAVSSRVCTTERHSSSAGCTRVSAVARAAHVLHRDARLKAVLSLCDVCTARMQRHALEALEIRKACHPPASVGLCGNAHISRSPAAGAGSALPHVETPIGALGDRQPAPVPAVHDARKGQRLVTSKDGHKRK